MEMGDFLPSLMLPYPSQTVGEGRGRNFPRDFSPECTSCRGTSAMTISSFPIPDCQSQCQNHSFVHPPAAQGPPQTLQAPYKPSSWAWEAGRGRESNFWKA